jgi:type II secretory ATPase GspE/PulE/Tfp pilus assembly ATPase PilB-like protein
MEISAPKILEDLVAQAARAGASDIHLQMRDGAAQVSFRLDGLMTDAAPLSAEVAERVFGRIKFLARLYLTRVIHRCRVITKSVP